MTRWRDFGLGDKFVRPDEPDKVYEIVHFSTFKGGYIDGALLVTYAHPDGSSWTMTALVFANAGFQPVVKRKTA